MNIQTLPASSLQPPHWSYYTSSRNPTATSPGVIAHQELYKWIEDRFNAGEPVYVRFNDHRRRGSVGRLDTFEFEQATPINKTQSHYNYYRYHYPDYATYRPTHIVVKWDGRSNKVHPSWDDIEILTDYDGGTVWAFDQSKPTPKPIPVIKDHLGEEVVADDFVSFVSRKYGNIKLHFGTISRINHNGSVWVNTLKLRDGDVAHEVKVHDTDTIVKIGKDLVDRLVMARLAAR